MLIDIKPIGVIRTKHSDDEIRSSWEGVDGIVEVFEEFREGLERIDGFSHIILIAWLHKVGNEARKTLKVKHGRLIRFGVPPEQLPLVGVFCTNSPHRPNPIGISIVKLVKRIDRYLYVSNLDLFNETPILDIRPYTPSRVITDIKVPKWYERLKELIEKYVKSDS